MRVTWLLPVLRNAGLTVNEVDGWKGRGSPLAALRGVVCHHTATGPKSPDDRVAALLRDGRPDLKGPLAQLGLDRTGGFWLIADGRANHNGFGLWGNESIGIEAFNDGVGEPWPAAQVDAWERGCAAIVAHLDFDAAQVKGHKETDSKRKVDPHGIDMGLFRTNVRRRLTTPTQEDPLAMFYKDAADARRWLVRDTYWKYTLRGPTAKDMTDGVAFIAMNGADAFVAAVADSKEAGIANKAQRTRLGLK